VNHAKRILIIDDEETIVDILRRRFERMGFSVATAFNGLQGIDTLRNEQVDVIVCDIKMPKGVSGIDVLYAAKKYNPNARFVAISGHLVSDESVQGIMKGGAALFIKKPFPSLGEITQQIADLVETRN
jgi:DNA-binding NtrC family response regulator